MRWLFSVLLPIAQISAAQTQGVTLTAKLINSTVQLSLSNRSSAPLTVLTGVITDHKYPAANFTFLIELPKKQKFTLDCQTCAPQIIAGSIGAYNVRLDPGTSSVVATIPLSEFVYVNAGEQRLCTPATQKALFTATIQARRWSAVSEVQNYWTGTASSTVRVGCKR